MTKNKKLGLVFLLGPICILVVILVIYAIVSFAISTGSPSETGLLNTGSVTGLVQQSRGAAIASIINVVLGLLGVICVLGIIVGVPLGIYFLARKEPGEVATTLTGPQYQGLTPEQLKYISSWSWGAFFGSMVWPLGNKLYLWAVPALANLAISILLLVLAYTQISPMAYIVLSFLNMPLGLVSFIFLIYLAIKGRRLAWEKGWPSFEAFKNRQKVMAWIILATIIAVIIIEGVFIFLSMQNLPRIE